MDSSSLSGEMNHHAQELFDAWPHPEGLPALYRWLMERNIDANVYPHTLIAHLVAEDTGDLAREARGVHVNEEG